MRCRLRRCNADVAATIAAVFKLYKSIDEREERIVFPAANINSGLVPRAALANQNRARVNPFAAKAFHAEPLSLRVAAVYAGAAAFLMCHCRCLPFLEGDVADLHGSVILPVTARDFVLSAGLEF
jgi:hypothetical protein